MYLQFLVLLLCALYGLVFALGKLTLLTAPPLFITAGRMMLASAILLIYLFIFHRKQLVLKKSHYWPIFIVGFSNVYLTNALEFWGLQFMGVGKACFLYSFSPIATALMSYFWFSETITFKKWIGLIIGIFGFIPILIAHASNVEDLSGTFYFLSFAEIALLGAAVATSVGWMTMRVMVKEQALSSVMANAASMLVGGLLALIHSLIVEDWAPFPVEEFTPFIQWFLALTLVSNLICYNLNAMLLKHFTATYIAFAGLSTPFFAALFGWLLLSEVVTVAFWISVIAVSIGLYIYYREELKQGYLPQVTSPSKKI